MIKKLQKYLFSLLLALLTVLGWYYTQVKQGISFNTESKSEFLNDFVVNQQDVYFLQHHDGLYKSIDFDYSVFSKINADISEKEMDEKAEFADSSNELFLLKNNFWNIFLNFFTQLHTQKSAVFFATYNNIKTSLGYLYLKYNVFRL